MMDRYDRQRMIPGWNQDALRKAKVAVIGSGHLAVQTALGLTGLGVGDIMIVDNSRAGNFPHSKFFTGDEGSSNAESLEQRLMAINPDIHVTGMHWLLRYQSDASVLEGRSLIIDATNDPNSKYNALMFAKSHRVPVIVAGANDACANVQACDSKATARGMLQEGFAGSSQGILPAGVAAGLVLDRTRKYLMPLPGDEDFSAPLNYNMHSTERFSRNGLDCPGALPCYDFSNRRAAVIGAGSLGNMAAIQLALLGVGNIAIIDYDHIEAANLNRQLLLYGRVGESKSLVLAERLAEINPSAAYTPLDARVDAYFVTYMGEWKPDVIFDCVDNFSTRAALNRMAKTLGIPLVSGGTDFQSGQVVSYVPGETACLECQLEITKYAEAEAEREAEHCALAPEPSVVVSNQLIGNLMAAEAFAALANSPHLVPSRGILKYVSASAATAGVFNIMDPCTCHLMLDGGGTYEPRR